MFHSKSRVIAEIKKYESKVSNFVAMQSDMSEKKNTQDPGKSDVSASARNKRFGHQNSKH